MRSQLLHCAKCAQRRRALLVRRQAAGARPAHLQAAVTKECTWPIISLSADLASGPHAILNSSMNLPDTAGRGKHRCPFGRAQQGPLHSKHIIALSARAIHIAVGFDGGWLVGGEAAPDVSASSGQGRNQLMVQPLMRPGNCCARRANLAPTGLRGGAWMVNVKAGARPQQLSKMRP